MDFGVKAKELMSMESDFGGFLMAMQQSGFYLRHNKTPVQLTIYHAEEFF
jgi:hypothetical protein